ncbi:DNA translocase FtsK [Treponema sp. Marseille-Q4132]|uniref:DNA translocase FtsK n=1 Tax=Treponema sp. Marseille-Q4132 TaxID=2766701 RepID=UPI001652D2A8|nr:DNA translocase FtsK [Treponema sp. Marseille-Q4132]QNL96590.1 cell division protein FtsK [Treponema sp. Marseille-Q4132]
MERLNKLKYAAGVVLLLFAAVFSLALILQPFDFIAYTAGFGASLFLLGTMLFSIYGFSSILIPAFLFAAAMTCFSGKWTARKAMRLLTAAVPFFTAVITENICKAIGEFSADFTGIKIGVTIAFGIMLIVIEWLGAGIIADKITQSAKRRGFEKIPREKTGEETDSGTHDEKRTASDFSADDTEVENEGESDPYESAREIDSLAKMPARKTNERGEAFSKEKESSSDIVSPFENVFDEAGGDRGDAEDGEKSGAERKGEDASALISEEEFTALTARDDAPLGEIEELSWPDFPEENAGASYLASDEDTGESGKEERKTVPFWERERPRKAEDMISSEEDDFLQDSDENGASDDESVFGDRFETDGSINSSDELLHGESLDPDFFDVDLNEETDDTAFDGKTNTIYDVDLSKAGTASGNETPRDFAGNVFNDMDADVRKNLSNFNNSLSAGVPVIEDGRTVSGADATTSKEELEAFFGSAREKEIPALKPEPVKKMKPKGPYKIPANLLTEYKNDQYWIIDEETKKASAELKETLNEFNIEADIIGIKKGPVVTMFELLPAPGVKLSKIAALQDNIALRLAASSVRIVAPIPGKKAVGIEIPNKERSIVSFREIVEKDMSEYKKMSVPVILGKDILGKPQIIDLVKTPHLLIAGATGSGKSVCVNSMILSILYKRSPQEVKLILIDPKIVELKLYNDIPHLLVPVITEPKKAFQALQWALCEMERRYALLDGMGCRDVASYNKKIEEKHIATEKIPYIVLIIDEFADLMATTGKELESTVARLAAMSRAIGIHLVLATQRPSTDVITGLIKANIPARIAFMVASGMDSRIIIDQVGAEKLLGRGDMLYSSAVNPFPVRIQGTFVSDQEVEDVVSCVKKYGEPEYIDEEIFVPEEEESSEPSLFDGEDPLYNQALDIVVQSGKASASYIQRRLKIGYNRAARLVEEMEARGIVGPANGSKPREIIHIP